MITLGKVIEIEEKLLKIENKYIYSLEFSEVLNLKKYLSEIASITDIYFELLEGKGFDSEDEAIKYNTNILNSEIDDDFINHKKINQFVNYICTKYNIIDF